MTATPAALAAVARVVAQRGPVIFVQSAGCCDGSAPMCLEAGELLIGPNDVRLGDVGGAPVYVDGRHAVLWRRSQLVLDVAPGEPDGFSLAAGPGWHFVARSRLLTEEQAAACPLPADGHGAGGRPDAPHPRDGTGS